MTKKKVVLIDLFGRLLTLSGLIAGLLIAFWIDLEVSRYFGVDLDTPLKYQPTWSVLLFVALLFGGVLAGALLGSLCAFYLSAHLFGVSRLDMENLIRRAGELDPRERIAIVQSYYAWCLDQVYGRNL